MHKYVIEKYKNSVPMNGTVSNDAQAQRLRAVRAKLWHKQKVPVHLYLWLLIIVSEQL